MAIIITEACVGCGACQSRCMLEAIVPNGDQYMIVAENCSECGSCVDYCPEGAITDTENDHLEIAKGDAL